MRVAVTGATGFVGRHVIGALRELGHRAEVWSRSTAPPPPFLDASSVLRVDLEAPEAVLAGAATAPDVLIHLAWGSLNDFRSRRHFEHELPLHYRFLRAMVEGGVRRIVVAGTCLEYGLRAGALEEDQPTDPVCAYGLAKDTLHRQLRILRRDCPFDLRWGRLFYVYGDGQAQKALWPSLRSAAQRGDPHFPMSGGEQLRDYLPVEEAARGLAAMALSHACPPAVNLCSGRPVAVRTLVESWIESNAWTIRPLFGVYPYPDYEPMAFWGVRNGLDTLLHSSTK